MYEYKVKEIVKVIDGDTIDLVLDLGFGLYKKERVRLGDIDAPETRTRNPLEKEYGKAAKAYVENWFRNHSEFICKTEKEGKYGRTIGYVCNSDNIYINDAMIENGIAWKYKDEKDFKKLKFG
jgi:micrococcal nuclease